MNTPTRAALALLLALPLAACDHDHDHGTEPEVDQVAEGCKHMEFGPEVALEISDLGEVQTIETYHTRYDMTLTDSSDAGYTGLIEYTSRGGMHFLLFDQDFDFAIADASGAPVDPMMIERSPPSCDLAAVVHHVELPAGTYSFSFDAVPEPLLELVVHVANQDHDHAH